jgi:hypothetical protein
MVGAASMIDFLGLAQRNRNNLLSFIKGCPSGNLDYTAIMDLFHIVFEVRAKFTGVLLRFFDMLPDSYNIALRVCGIPGGTSPL